MCLRQGSRRHAGYWQAIKDTALDIFTLRCGFDHQIGLTQSCVAIKRLDPLQQCLAIRRRHLFAINRTRHLLGNGLLALFCGLKVEIAEQNAIARLRRNLRDARAHLTCSDHTDCLDHASTPFALDRGAIIARYPARQP